MLFIGPQEARKAELNAGSAFYWLALYDITLPRGSFDSLVTIITRTES